MNNKIIKYFVINLLLIVVIISSKVLINYIVIKNHTQKIDECLKNGGQAVLKDKVYLDYCIEKKYCDFDPLAKYN